MAGKYSIYYKSDVYINGSNEHLYKGYNTLSFAIFSAKILKKSKSHEGVKNVLVLDESINVGDWLYKVVYSVEKGYVNYARVVDYKKGLVASWTLATLKQKAVERGFKRNAARARRKTLEQFLLNSLLNDWVKELFG